MVGRRRRWSLNNYLRNMMAKMESYEAASEFGIPEVTFEEYEAFKRSDDLYIACLASVFDALRLPEEEAREKSLADIAKTLVIYSRSAVARHLSGVEKRLNQVYAASLFYLAGFPATAALLARPLESIKGALEEEAFLHGFLAKSLKEEHPLEQTLLESLRADTIEVSLNALRGTFEKRAIVGLEEDPRLFIAAKLTQFCLQRFSDTNVWATLRQYASNYTTELWLPFLGSTRAFPIWELLPSQVAAIKCGILGDTDETFSLQMPTSAGKTALCELLIYHEVKARHRRVLFLVPFRALAAEIRDGMSRRLSDAGIGVIASHGGNIPTRSETNTVENADVLIITPEKFTALTQVVPEFENQFQTIICDEGHLIDDDSRGLQYELLLTKLRGTKEAPRKIVFISAILPNVDQIHEWLGGKPHHLAQSDYRPVETDFAFLMPQNGSKDNWYLDVNPIYQRPRSYTLLRFLVKDDFRFLNAGTGRQKLVDGWKSYLSLACAAALKARRNGSVALFTTTRGDQGVAGLAKKMISLCESNALVSQNSPRLSKDLPLLMEFVEFLLGPEYVLSKLLRFGVGFHHGRLPQEIRREMEESIQNGTINILICTNTLAEGVNLPIRTLVVHTVRRYNWSNETWDYLHNRSVKNIIGRAGRAGKETRGRVIFVNDAEQAALKRVLRDEAMEAAHGALYRLVVAIYEYITKNRINLNNDIIDKQTDHKFLSLIDSIDFTLLDLIPIDTPQEQINNHIGELLDRTLAKRFCNTAELRTCLETIFQLRAAKLQQSVAQDTWRILKITGSSPRFYTFVIESQILEHPLWLSLTDSLNEQWLNEVIIQLLEFASININVERDTLHKVIRGWMSGMTYAELSVVCGGDVDTTLQYICQDIGYSLQDHVAKLCQLAIVRYGEDFISDIARNWASLLQYGLRNLQQLDIVQQGGSDRLGNWGIFRILQAHDIYSRDAELIDGIRAHGKFIRTALEQDGRVPRISASRICKELRL
jgi:helicase